MEEKIELRNDEEILEACLKVKQAVTDLYHKYGEEKNRNLLRPEFKSSKGNENEEEQKNIFNDYLEKHRAELAELRREYDLKLRKSQEEKDKIVTECFQYKKKLVGYKETVEGKYEEFDNMTSQINDLTHENEVLKHKNEQFEKKCQEFIGKHESVKSRIQEIVQAYEKTEKTIEKYAQFQSRMLVNIDELDHTLKVLNDQNVNYSKQNYSLIQVNEKLKSSMIEKETEIMTQKKLREDMELNCEKIQEHVTEILSAEKSGEQNEKMLASLRKTSEQNARQEKEILEMSMQHKQMQYNNSVKMRNLSRDLAREREMNSKRVQELTTNNVSLEDSARKIRMELERAKKEMADVTQKRVRLQDRVRVTEDEASDLRVQLAEREQRLTERIREGRELGLQVGTLAKQVETLETMNSKLFQENQELTLRNKNLEDNLFKKETLLAQLKESRVQQAGAGGPSLVGGMGIGIGMDGERNTKQKKNKQVPKIPPMLNIPRGHGGVKSGGIPKPPKYVAGSGSSLSRPGPAKKTPKIPVPIPAVRGGGGSGIGFSKRVTWKRPRVRQKPTVVAPSVPRVPVSKTMGNMPRIPVVPLKKKKKKKKKKVMENDPVGSIVSMCGVCAKKLSGMIITCVKCTRKFHDDCLNVDMDEITRFVCSDCGGGGGGGSNDADDSMPSKFSQRKSSFGRGAGKSRPKKRKLSFQSSDRPKKKPKFTKLNIII